MKLKRTAAVIAGATVAAIALSACSTPDVGGIGDEAQNVTVGWNESFRSTNNLTPSGNATANANIIYLMTSNWQQYEMVDGVLTFVDNTDFGTVEVVSEDPLVVTYTINEGVVWSDGTPVDAADIILSWGAQNDMFDTVAAGDLERDEEGNQIVPDDAVFFPSSSTVLNLITEFPVIGDDGRSVTLTFDRPTSDWMMGMTGPSPVAAHVVGRLALGIEDPQEAKDAVMAAFENNDAAKLAPIADTFTNAFNFTSLPDDEGLFLSYGAFVISEFVEGQYIRLVRNELFDWGREPQVDSITVRFNEDPMAAVTALQNGEVDLIAPQSSVDVLAALDGIDGVTFTTDIEGTWEHVDLTFNNGGPFDPATYGGDAETARLVRQAFLKTVPRADIIDRLIRPLQDDAAIRNSFLFVPGAPGYAETVAVNGTDAFNEVDIEGAKALLEQAGVETPIDVRFMFGASNVRRANQFQLIQASAAEAGFNVLDYGNDQWGAALGNGTYDAVLFGWQSTNTMILNGQANYVTGGMNNFGGFSNADVDAAWTELQTSLDEARNVELAQQIESILIHEGFGLPIFQFPGVVAHRDTLQNVSTMPLSPTIFWNYWEWTVGN